MAKQYSAETKDIKLNNSIYFSYLLGETYRHLRKSDLPYLVEIATSGLLDSRPRQYLPLLAPLFECFPSAP